MGFQSLCCSFPTPNIFNLAPTDTVPIGLIAGGYRRTQPTVVHKSYSVSGLRWRPKVSQFADMRRLYVLRASQSDMGVNLSLQSNSKSEGAMGSGGVSELKLVGVEPFRGKSGSVSFYGVTHQVIEESKLVSSPYSDGVGSFVWVLAPAVLMLSFALPQFYIANVVASFFTDELLAETAAALSSEAVLYVGVAIFLLITDWVQRPYLEFSSKRWSLITGLKGILASTFFTMGLKVIAPIAVTYITWPFLGAQALILVTPLLVGYLAQLAVENFVFKRGSSCWPIVPIIFEVYRLYQLARGVHSVDKLMFLMRGLDATTQIVDRGRALLAMTVTFEAVAVVCLWSLLTFLLRLFPSRPVAENY